MKPVTAEEGNRLFAVALIDRTHRDLVTETNDFLTWLETLDYILSGEMVLLLETIGLHKKHATRWLFSGQPLSRQQLNTIKRDNARETV